MPTDYFGDAVAKGYDASCALMFEPAVVEPAVSLLAELAGTGPALELGIGTGRLALPLSRRGVPVHGIDLSPAMVSRLQAKPGADAIGVTLGDFATTRVAGTFTLVYLVFNTIMNLTTQDEQVACFCNAAAHLERGGHFVVEVGVPALRRLPPDATFVLAEVTPEHVCVDEYDVVTQGLISHHFWVGGRFYDDEAPFRYVWPSELDLMARIAGMTLRERWTNWNREPFNSESGSHVSIWEKA